ncbi:glycoside hydrolase family 88 protein [Neobacillus bataviensis]|uniref:glycoside hydrolase family 88 protein n=1 Tax=Neobacillus bataviensis TaxID=220685 RepID=UPI001CBD85A1|nr:glycoside hydrolase family 88 protein [Neobacillus bataviensis]
MDQLFPKILELADATTKRLVPEKLPWMWGEGLLMHALGQLNDLLGDARYTDYIKRYVDFHLKKGLRVDQSDTLAPILATYYLSKHFENEDYRSVTDRGLTYIKHSKKIIHNMPNHLGHSLEGKFYPKSIWVDSIMMYGVFTSLYAREQEEEWLMEFAKIQPELFEKYLKAPDDKLFVHSYWVRLKKQYPQKLYWGRGNGWVVGALPMLIDNLENGQERNKAIRILQELSEALISYQRPDGYFETLLNKPGTTKKESSATALIASGWMHGVRSGYLDRNYLEPGLKAFKAVAADLDFRDGLISLGHISGPTIPIPIFPKLGYKLQYTFQRSRDWSYGLAALFFAGIEYKKLIIEGVIK